MEWIQGQKHNKYNINIICPHPGHILHRHPFDHYKKQISHNHSITIDTCDCIFADYTYASNKQNTQQPAVIRKPISIDDFAETPFQRRTSSQIHFLICETCFWCASLVSQVPDHATILDMHTCKHKRICSYMLV